MSKDMEPVVPDSIRPYLNEIAERLWAGRAAVMVGSGFSKNAGNVFPDWNQLGNLFFQKAYGVKPDPTPQKYWSWRFFLWSALLAAKLPDPFRY